MKLLRLFIAIGGIFIAPAMQAASQVSPQLTLDVVINTDQPSRPAGSMGGMIIIKNTGDEPVTVEHPRNRMAVAFILLDSLGNIVLPEGIAKVDPQTQQITIQPHSEYQHPFDRLEFITGSALFGYTLKTGETYRLVAVYRPHGAKNAGITSPERTFNAK